MRLVGLVFGELSSFRMRMELEMSRIESRVALHEEVQRLRSLLSERQQQVGTLSIWHEAKEQIEGVETHFNGVSLGDKQWVTAEPELHPAFVHVHTPMSTDPLPSACQEDAGDSDGSVKSHGSNMDIQPKDKENVHDKRVDFIEMMKAKDVYRRIPEEERPPTPDPRDRTMSKRTWEKRVKEWRSDIRSNSKTAGPTEQQMLDS